MLAIEHAANERAADVILTLHLPIVAERQRRLRGEVIGGRARNDH